VAVASAGPYASLHHANTPPLSFLQAGCSSCRPTNSVKALKERMKYDTPESNRSTYNVTTPPGTPCTMEPIRRSRDVNLPTTLQWRRCSDNNSAPQDVDCSLIPRCLVKKIEKKKNIPFKSKVSNCNSLLYYFNTCPKLC